MTLTEVSSYRSFGGEQKQFTHASSACHCDMRFSIYLPPQVKDGPAPVLWWLSGLTCTDENFVQKAGAQAYAAEHGLIIVAPDTSPRGEGVPDDADAAYDFGLGAGFYVNATQSPWSEHYHMYDYIVDELHRLVAANFPVLGDKQSIFGHSMGGHGALTIALKNPQKYKSVSAFAPIVSPMNCPWGHKALAGYLGEDRKDWEQYDACALVEKAKQPMPILVDQGEGDNFLIDQLKPELLEEACAKAGYPLTLRRQPGYDHSYFFMASFMADHVAFHANVLNS